MKITQYDDLYAIKVGSGETTLVSGSSGGSNSGFAGDVTGTWGDLSVVGLRQRVSLSSNIAPSAAIGNVLTLISAGAIPVAQFTVPSNSGSASFGSNATRVSKNSSVGASTNSAREDHIHDGIGTITASSSNTAGRGTFNIRQGNNVDLGWTDTDGDGLLDTVTINARAGSSSGGGSPASDYYSGTTGTGQVVIPGLQVADRQPASPNAKDDEFTALSGWTSLGTLDTSNVTDAVSHWHAVKAMPASVVTHGIYKTAPAMPFTLWTKLSDAIIDTDFHGYGFVLTESAPGKCTTFHVIHDGTVGRFAMYKFTNNTTFSASTNGTGYALAQRTPLYMKLLVTSSTDVTLTMSWDGLYYRSVGISNLNPNLTVANFGLALVTAGGSVTCDGYFDYIRVT